RDRVCPGQPAGRRVLRGARPADPLPVNSPAVANAPRIAVASPGTFQVTRSSPGVGTRLLRNKSAVVGGSVLLVIVLFALAAPLIAPYDPIKTNQRLS